MLTHLIEQYSVQIATFNYLLIAINACLHLIFAGAVARDAASLTQRGQCLALVSAGTWAFAALLGGVITVAIYWFIHHSTLTRPTRDIRYDRP